MTQTKLKQFIDDNLEYFTNLGNSEVEYFSVDKFDNDVIEYLKEHYRFDYKDICVYYVIEKNNIWVENMNS
jgi:hypothetical protein